MEIVTKERKGRFQVTVMKNNKVYKDNTFQVDRKQEYLRVCIQHGRQNKATGEWINQQIWCDPSDLRNLLALIETLGHSDSQ